MVFFSLSRKFFNSGAIDINSSTKVSKLILDRLRETRSRCSSSKSTRRAFQIRKEAAKKSASKIPVQIRRKKIISAWPDWKYQQNRDARLFLFCRAWKKIELIARVQRAKTEKKRYKNSSVNRQLQNPKSGHFEKNKRRINKTAFACSDHFQEMNFSHNSAYFKLQVTVNLIFATCRKYERDCLTPCLWAS